jgi:hypothetical protein
MVLLLVGGGIAPPVIGILLGLAATNLHAPVRWWGRPPWRVLQQTLAKVWPWFLGADVAALLALFPGLVLTGATLGGDTVPQAVAYALMLAAFVCLPSSLVAALALDALRVFDDRPTGIGSESAKQAFAWAGTKLSNTSVTHKGSSCER